MIVTANEGSLCHYIQGWINNVRGGSFSCQGNHIKASSKLVAFNMDMAGKAVRLFTALTFAQLQPSVRFLFGQLSWIHNLHFR